MKDPKYLDREEFEKYLIETDKLMFTHFNNEGFINDEDYKEAMHNVKQRELELGI